MSPIFVNSIIVPTIVNNKNKPKIETNIISKGENVNLLDSDI